VSHVNVPPPPKESAPNVFQSIPPGADPRLISGAGPSGVSGTVQTVAEATNVVLHSEEAQRSASFGRVVAILCAVGLIFASFDSTPFAQRMSLVIAQAVLGSVGTWVWWRSRDPRGYSRTVFRIFSLTAATAAIVFIHYFGVFSPATTVVVLGIAFFAQTDDRKWLYTILSAIIVAFFGSAMMIAIGVLPDLGMFVPKGVPLVQRVTMVVMASAVLIMQLVQARLSRRATLEALKRATEAARMVLTREAQLAEAKENLDAAIKAHAGKGGRYTGERFGRFHLEEIVGRGAMGEIYAATVQNAGPGARAAVKVLLGARRDEPDIVRRFLKEAEIAARVRGPNLVQMYEAGTAPDGAPFIAMELLLGSDLATLLRERTLLPVPEALTLIDDVARGLEQLHQAGVVHRDLKPQNLFLALGPPTSWKILDYGVSKITDGNVTLTMGQLIGTPGYMSPEQAEGRDVDQRSDVFALGAVAYRALTGRRPFVGPDTPQILYQVVFGMPVRPREVVPSLPRDVELVLGMAIAKKPQSRFDTATGFANALRAAASGKLDPRLRTNAERVARQMPWSHDPIATSRAATGA
jgi:eukaryotic-like serine/threonine-protein kinase